MSLPKPHVATPKQRDAEAAQVNCDRPRAPVAFKELHHAELERVKDGRHDDGYKHKAYAFTQAEFDQRAKRLAEAGFMTPCAAAHEQEGVSGKDNRWQQADETEVPADGVSRGAGNISYGCHTCFLPLPVVLCPAPAKLVQLGTHVGATV
jgi:hypothetical protein